MKANLYKNIDLLRIPVQAGIQEYYFPQNVDWAECKVDRIAACVPSKACVDPMDGVTPVLTLSDIPDKDVYFNIYTKDQRELLHAVSIEDLLHSNNHPIYLGEKLDLSLCNLYFKSAPAQDYTLLLYVFHTDGDKCETSELPDNSVTLEFPLQADEEINLQQLITTYIHALPAKVKGVMFWNAENNPAYITLRDYELTYILQNIHSEMARPPMNGGTAPGTQADMMLFDNIDIDFQYSHIRNAESQANTQRITFLY